MNEQQLAEGRRLLRQEIRELHKTRFIENKNFIQHGTTSVYQHCVSVAYRSVIIAAQLDLNVNMQAMIRGALLHDYFLYDWHGKKLRELHGFHHPRIACENALRDFDLDAREQDIIRKHMFPMTIIPPKYKEAWIICLADKLCSSQETLKLRPTHWLPNGRMSD